MEDKININVEDKEWKYSPDTPILEWNPKEKKFKCYGVTFSGIGSSEQFCLFLKNLIVENEQLKEKKQKAIDYVKDKGVYRKVHKKCLCGLSDYNLTKLLEILGGVDNE